MGFHGSEYNFAVFNSFPTPHLYVPLNFSMRKWHVAVKKSSFLVNYTLRFFTYGKVLRMFEMVLWKSETCTLCQITFVLMVGTRSVMLHLRSAGLDKVGISTFIVTK